jgi:hypothetical protein
MNNHPITRALESQGIPTFGSLERQKARLERFNKASAKRWASEHIRHERSLLALFEQYRMALARGFDEDADAVHAEILYRLKEMRTQ